MAWKLIEPFQRTRWSIGQIAVKSVKNSVIMPKELVGKGFNWYFEDVEGIVKLELNDKSIRKLGHAASFPKQLRELFKDDQAVCYYDEDAIYFATYKAGQKKLVSFLKQNKIV
jgi:hypothetical protein